MTNVADAEAAIAEINGTEIDGKLVVVEKVPLLRSLTTTALRCRLCVPDHAHQLQDVTWDLGRMVSESVIVVLKSGNFVDRRPRRYDSRERYV